MATALDILKGTFGVQAPIATDPGIIKLSEIKSGQIEGFGNFTYTPELTAAIVRGEVRDPLLEVYAKNDELGYGPLVTKIATAAFGAVAGFGLGGILGAGISGATKLVEQAASTPKPPGGPMAFSDGDSGFSLPSLGDIGSIFQGQLGRDLLGIGTQALSGFVANQFAPQPTMMAAAGPVMRAGGAVATVGRAFFNRFPNLAAGIQRLRNAGANVTRSSLWSMMKRFGPDFLVAGGILTAAAVSELAMAGPGRRRMNPGNVKALRRAHRRMKSFHNVCMTNDRLLGGRRSTKRKGSFGGATSVVNVK